MACKYCEQEAQREKDGTPVVAERYNEKERALWDEHLKHKHG